MNRRITRAGSIAAMALLIAGCSDESGSSADVTAEDVGKEVADVMDVAGNYTEAKRAALNNQAQQTLDTAKRELDEVRQEVAELPNAVQAKLEDAISRAERAQRQLDDEIDSLEEATSDRWATVEKRVSTAMGEVVEARREIAAALRGENGSGGTS